VAEETHEYHVASDNRYGKQGDQAMNKLGVVAFAAAALTVSAAASAQAQTPASPDVSHVTRAPALPPPPQQGEPQSRSLFTIGGFEVHLWAPVEPHYDPNLNRNQAANPVWDDGP
jgi:hypothetical protein